MYTFESSMKVHLAIILFELYINEGFKKLLVNKNG